MSEIDAYLAELSRRLRVSPSRRSRILEEVRAHLEDAGQVEGFGDPEELSAQFNALEPRSYPRLAALAVLGGIIVVFGFVQGLESHIPPAPWPEGEAPGGLEPLFDLATVCYLAAIALAVGALLAGRAALGYAACAALGIAVLALVVHAVRRAEFVAGSPPLWQLALASFTALLPPLIATALLSGSARRPRSGRARPPHSG